LIYNTKNSYGWIAIFVHWLMALAIFGMLGLGLYMVELTYYDSLYKTLPHIHKSVGLILAAVLLFRVVWKVSNAKPEAISGMSRFEKLSARIVHSLSYILIASIMTSGYLISTAEGAPVSIFGVIEVPAAITNIPEQEDIAGLVHLSLAYTLIAIVVLHAAAALKHHFINHDNTLRRMLGMSKQP
jgi:cytochrome b561